MLQSDDACDEKYAEAVLCVCEPAGDVASEGDADARPCALSLPVITMDRFVMGSKPV